MAAELHGTAEAVGEDEVTVVFMGVEEVNCLKSVKGVVVADVETGFGKEVGLPCMEDGYAWGGKGAFYVSVDDLLCRAGEVKGLCDVVREEVDVGLVVDGKHGHVVGGEDELGKAVCTLDGHDYGAMVTG